MRFLKSESEKREDFSEKWEKTFNISPMGRSIGHVVSCVFGIS